MRHNRQPFDRFPRSSHVFALALSPAPVLTPLLPGGPRGYARGVPLMAVVVWSRRGLARERVRFVEARTARGLLLGGVAALSAAALAAGVAIGLLLDRDRPANAHAAAVERNYEIEEIGKLAAALTQIEPRLAQLNARVDALSAFDTRLTETRQGGAHLVPPLPDNLPLPSDAPLDGAGGPALPPRPCEAARIAEGRGVKTMLARTRETLDCVDKAALLMQHALQRHETALMAFPGRDPAPGARNGSPFGNRADPFTGRLNFHPGVDLVAPSGTPVLASAGGRVIAAGVHGGYGLSIDIRHADGLVTRYGHASKVLVQQGELVLPGQKIAEVGSTGRSTGAHLHFEVIDHNAQVDPRPFLYFFRTPPDA